MHQYHQSKQHVIYNTKKQLKKKKVKRKRKHVHFLLAIECLRSNRGFDYQGRKNTTVSGLTCQAWNSQTPHQYNFTEAYYFPDASMDDVSNYCQ